MAECERKRQLTKDFYSRIPAKNLNKFSGNVSELGPAACGVVGCTWSCRDRRIRWRKQVVNHRLEEVCVDITLDFVGVVGVCLAQRSDLME